MNIIKNSNTVGTFRYVISNRPSNMDNRAGHQGRG